MCSGSTSGPANSQYGSLHEGPTTNSCSKPCPGDQTNMQPTPLLAPSTGCDPTKGRNRRASHGQHQKLICVGLAASAPHRHNHRREKSGKNPWHTTQGAICHLPSLPFRRSAALNSRRHRLPGPLDAPNPHPQDRLGIQGLI